MDPRTSKASAARDALNEAFDELGGIAALVEFGKTHPEAFYRIWAELQPRQVVVLGQTTEESLASQKRMLGL